MIFEVGFDKSHLSPTQLNIIIPEEQIEIFEEVGRGSTGITYKAKLFEHLEAGHFPMPPLLVAIKKIFLKRRNLLEEFNKKIISETRVCVKLEHPNLIHLMGVIASVSDVNWIVMELATGGCLFRFLDSDLGQQMNIPLPIILKWTLQIVEAMIYLHNEKILHCDLKADNILLNTVIKSQEELKSVELKLANISFFRFATTPSHIAPEVLKNYFCRKSDVWSFSVTVWEMIYKKRPFQGLEAFQIFYKVGVKRETLEIENDCDPYLGQLLKKCWIYEHDDRQSFEEIQEELQNITKDLSSR